MERIGIHTLNLHVEVINGDDASHTQTYVRESSRGPSAQRWLQSTGSQTAYRYDMY